MKTSTKTHDSPMLKDEHGRFLHSHQLMPLFGLRAGGHLPKEGFGPTQVNGVTFLCRPVPHGQGNGRRAAHRLLFECKCKRFIPFGRANQHKCEETRRG